MLLFLGKSSLRPGDWSKTGNVLDFLALGLRKQLVYLEPKLGTIVYDELLYHLTVVVTTEIF